MAEEKPTPSTQENITPTTYEQEQSRKGGRASSSFDFLVEKRFFKPKHGDLEQPNQTIDDKQQSKNLHHQPNLASASSSASMGEKVRLEKIVSNKITFMSVNLVVMEKPDSSLQNLDSCSEDNPASHNVIEQWEALYEKTKVETKNPADEFKGKEEEIDDVENQELPSLQTKQEQINRLLEINQDLFKAFDIKQRGARSFQEVIDNALKCCLELDQQPAKLSELEQVEEDERQQQRSLGEVTKEFLDVIKELQKSVVFFGDKVDKGAALAQAKQQKREVEALFDEFVQIASASTSSSEHTP